MDRPIVAIDARLLGRRGTGDTTYWTGLLHGLSRIEHGLRFLLLSNVEKPLGIPESPYFEWRTLRSRIDRWWSLVRFPLAARSLGAKAIHTQYNLSPLAGRIAVTTIHDVSFLIEPAWFRAKDRALLRRFVPASARRAGRVITVSESSKRDILEHLPFTSEKLRVTPLAAHPGIRRVPREEAAARVRNQFGVSEPYLLAVGTRWPRKNVSLAVRAVEGLPNEVPHRLAITGKSGWGEEERGSRVIETGYAETEQLCDLYSAADLFLVPSLHEGFGLTVLEAFVCGCPVVCSQGGALPEVAGDAALVVPSWEPADWTRAIAGLLSDSSKLQAMRDAGSKRAEGFRWEETAETTCAVYREVIS